MVNITFVCRRCGWTVHRATDQDFEPEFPICYMCRFIDNNPQLPQETIDKLRGLRPKED